jgi:ABC-type polysaccharide/polyol phosphate export permease
MLKPFIQYRELLWELTMREIKSRYKQSILGYAWVILNPFFQMIVLAIVFSQIIRIPNLDVPYPMFLYVGLLPWTLFSNSVVGSTNSLVQNTSLITKVYFPREVLVLSSIIAKVVDFFLASSVFILFMMFYRIGVTWNLLWFVPIFAIQLIFTYGLSLFTAAFNLFYRDVQYLLGLAILLWMYLTPIIYSTNMFPEKYQWIFKANPLSVLVISYRDVILYGNMPNLIDLSVVTVFSILLLGLGWFIFKKLEGVFADVV